MRRITIFLLLLTLFACGEDPTAPVGDFYDLAIEGNLEVSPSGGAPLKLGNTSQPDAITGTMQIAATKQSKEGLLVSATEFEANAPDPSTGTVNFDFAPEEDTSGTLYFTKSGGPLGVSFIRMTLLMVLSDGQVLNLGSQLFEAQAQNPYILSLTQGIGGISFTYNGADYQGAITELNLVMSDDLVDDLQ